MNNNKDFDYTNLFLVISFNEIPTLLKVKVSNTNTKM